MIPPGGARIATAGRAHHADAVIVLVGDEQLTGGLEGYISRPRETRTRSRWSSYVVTFSIPRKRMSLTSSLCETTWI